MSATSPRGHRAADTLAKGAPPESGDTEPNVPVLVGAMNDEVWNAVSTAAPNADVKLTASTASIMHALRVGKVHRVPGEKLGEVWSAMHSPDVVYKEKTEILFFKEIEKGRYIRAAFGYKKSGVLQLRSFSYFDDPRVKEQVINKKEKLYEKRQ